MPAKPKEAETGYQLWAHECAKNVRCVAERIGASPQAVYYWRQQYEWEQRREREMIPELVSILADCKIDVTIGMKEVVRALRKIVNESETNRDIISASRGLNEVYRTLVLATQPKDDVRAVEVDYRHVTQLPNGQQDINPVDILEANVSDHEPGR